jgi:allantoate deiminase
MTVADDRPEQRVNESGHGPTGTTEREGYVANAAPRAARVLARCDDLAAISEDLSRLTRRYGTPALRHAQDVVSSWLTGAGLAVRRDAAGNLLARYDGRDPSHPPLTLGSHLDTVRDAGRYDGPLGVLVALAAIDRLRERGLRPPFPIELAAFADEEGVRFHTSYLGSGAAIGRIDPAWLDRRDDDGHRLADVILEFGGDPAALLAGHAALGPGLGYVEVHIEQGPALEAHDLPVGVVTGIVGMSRIVVTFTGEAGHAGTVAMNRRRDALCAAAELVLAVEASAACTPGLVGTVGWLSAEPGASNVIPGRVQLTLDIRHPIDENRDAATRSIRQAAEAISTRRRINLNWQVLIDNPAIACDPDLTERLAVAVADLGLPIHRLPSGAGHDPVALSAVMPVSMLFVRCAGGVSHHPSETVTVADVAVAIAVLDRFLDRLAADLS